MSEFTYSAAKLGKDAVAVTILTGAARLAATIIIQGNVVAGHMDATCAVDPACENMVMLFLTNTLPTIAIPLMYAVGRIRSIVVYNCSTHPDGGTNEGFSARIE